MERYFATVCNIEDANAHRCSCDIARRLQVGPLRWTKPLDSDGVSVFVSPDATSRAGPYLLDRATGVVIGRLFRRNSEDDLDVRNPLLTEGGETTRILA